jgi:hypothetical protein
VGLVPGSGSVHRDGPTCSFGPWDHGVRPLVVIGTEWVPPADVDQSTTHRPGYQGENMPPAPPPSGNLRYYVLTMR